MCKQAWWMPVPKVLCLLSNLYIRREGCVVWMMNHKTAPLWKSKCRNFCGNMIAQIHHRAWEHRVKNNSIYISLKETVPRRAVTFTGKTTSKGDELGEAKEDTVYLGFLPRTHGQGKKILNSMFINHSLKFSNSFNYEYR